ncbi:J domain-containing protein [Bradyrhizobium sp. URHD0069]|uniref:J domain-containing protein n=1 Tax=Bradyrhizobium sp. URHD0069 TaxID=1380355 RepID=UPI0004954F5A|nr:J domain-containing protein [Bradyrhizobium sp. URHD0069]
MARRRKQDGSEIGLFLFVLAVLGAILLTAAVYASPIILFVSLLIYEIRADAAAKNFALDSSEAEALSEAEGDLNTIRVRLSDIAEEGSHLKQNADGMYHRGSKLGMTLNAELEELIPLEENLQIHVDEIRQKPLGRLDKWIRLASIRFALRATAAAYLGIGFILYQLDPPWMRGFSKLIGQYLLLHFTSVGDALYGSGLVAALSAVVLFPILYFSRRGMLDRSTDEIRQRLLETPEQKYKADADWEEDHEDDDARQEEPWYEILGVAPTASAKEINAAWRDLIKKSHPDRVADLDADFRALAEEKSRILNAARDEGLSR